MYNSKFKGSSAYTRKMNLKNIKNGHIPKQECVHIKKWQIYRQTGVTIDADAISSYIHMDTNDNNVSADCVNDNNNTLNRDNDNMQNQNIYDDE